MPRKKQTRDEILEKKRIAERRRMEKIKNDPDLHAQLRVKEREKYLKKKRTGNIVPISQMTPKQQKIMRKKSRESSKKNYWKSKNNQLNLVDELPINIENTDTDKNENDDPLGSPSPHTTKILKLRSFVASPKSRTNTPTKFTRSIISQMSATSVSPTFATNSRDVNLSSKCGSRPVTRQYNMNQMNQTECHLSLEVENDNTDNSFELPQPSPSRSYLESPVPKSTQSDTSCSTPHRLTIKEQSTKKSVKKRSPWKHILRRYKYRANKELQIKDRKIEDLKKLNERYRKQLKRLQIGTINQSNIKRNILQPVNKRNMDRSSIPSLLSDVSKAEFKKRIELFLEEDDNSRMCPGKKEYIKRNKIRKQKRYLSDTLQNLHTKFLQSHPDIQISYSFFCKLRPFWIISPNLNIRDTCLCKDHENMELVVTALRRNNLTEEKSAFEVLKSICCDPRDVHCLTRKCNLCKHRNIIFKEFDNLLETYYWIWKKNKKTYMKNGQEKVTIQTVKEKVAACPKDIIEYFENIINPYMRHCANIISQSNYIKKLKANLKSEECIIHCDFSENYSTKYASEIQSFHFGSSRQQITLHTAVIYYMKSGTLCTQSFCTMSECLRHDAIAIWEHLLPILSFVEDTVPEVDSLYFISDSPSAQYRNRKMFYIMSKLHWYYTSLRRVIWNYTEAGHGKGAPDGVGGVLKRTADKIVARGNDIQNMECLVNHLSVNVPGVILKVVEETGIIEKDLLVPSDLDQFRGTMSIHQVVWSSSNNNILAMRRLSCGQGECSFKPVECQHGQHIGFFNIGETTRRTSIRAPKQLPKTRNSALIKRTGKATDGGHSFTNLQDSLDLGPNDSFWAEVSSIDERVVTPKLAEAMLESIQGKIDDLPSSSKIEDDYDDVDDLKIFD